MIKFKKAGVWTDVLSYKIKKAGVWTDVQTGKFNKIGVYTIYYERMLLRRPPEGNYNGMGVILFRPDGDVKVGPKYHDAVTQVIGRWRASGVTPGISDVISIKVEKYLNQGDLEPGYNDALDTWIQLYPGSTERKWSSNNGGAGKAVLKITLKDQADRQLVYYAEIVFGGTGKIDYDPIDWSSGGGGGGGGGGSPVDPPGDLYPF